MRENEVFRNLIDNVPVSIYAKRSDLRQFYVNKGWCDLTGLSKEEAWDLRGAWHGRFPRIKKMMYKLSDLAEKLTEHSGKQPA